MNGDILFERKSILIWSICVLFFVYEFFLRTVLGAYQTSIIQDLHLSLFQFSILSTTLFCLIYGFMQIPVGFIVDNIGLKKSFVIGCSNCAIATLGFAYSDNYDAALFFRVLMGFGASFGFICLLISINDWIPHKYRAIFIGTSLFIGTLGPIIGAGPLSILANNPKYNWHFIFFMLSIFGFVLTVLGFFFVENKKQQNDQYVFIRKPEKLSKSLKILFSKSQPFIIAILSATLYFSIEYLSENEGRRFLILKGLDIKHASYMLALSWVGFAIGSPVFGFLSDFLQRRKLIMVIAAVFGFISIVTIVYSPLLATLPWAFFLLGISASGQSIGFATITEQFIDKFVAIGLGLNNAVIMSFAAINAPFIGYFFDKISANGNLTLHDYQLVLSILVIASLVAVILSVFFLKETFCKSAVNLTYLKRPFKPTQATAKKEEALLHD